MGTVKNFHKRAKEKGTERIGVEKIHVSANIGGHPRGSKIDDFFA